MRGSSSLAPSRGRSRHCHRAHHHRPGDLKGEARGFPNAGQQLLPGPRRPLRRPARRGAGRHRGDHRRRRCPSFAARARDYHCLRRGPARVRPAEPALRRQGLGGRLPAAAVGGLGQQAQAARPDLRHDTVLRRAGSGPALPAPARLPGGPGGTAQRGRPGGRQPRASPLPTPADV